MRLGNLATGFAASVLITLSVASPTPTLNAADIVAEEHYEDFEKRNHFFKYFNEPGYVPSRLETY